MKLVMVTFIEEYQQDVLSLLKKAEIDNFSESDIDGFKKSSNKFIASNWFSGESVTVNSLLIFSFTEEKNADALFVEIKKFNENLKTASPIKAAILPIEKFI
ncbi:hypothetical protein ACFLSU_00715 [Bacteroidota bacterium]